MNRISGDLEIYDIFHDECKEDGFWHCFIFIPRKKQRELFDLLQKSRENLNYWNPIHFSDLGQKCKSSSPRIRLIQSWCNILLFSIQQQKIDAQLYLGHKDNKPVYDYKRNDNCKIGARLVVFREISGHKDMYDNMRITKKVETTFRMGVKGGTHFLFSDEGVKIGNIYVDSPKEVFEEKYDSKNIWDRFKNESKENIFFVDDSRIIPVSKKDYKKTYQISEFMQLADLAVGGVRTQKLQLEKFFARFKATWPLKQELLEKDTKNFARMRESKYCKGFALSEAWIENDEWKFKEMSIDTEHNNHHESLF